MWTCCRDGAPPEQRAPVFNPTFPMYVVKAVDVLSMTQVQPHQQLLADGLLEAFDPQFGVAVFVSHQWTSRAHPDPTFQQFRVLQKLMQRARDRSLAVEPDLVLAQTGTLSASVRASELWGLGDEYRVWYDFFSVPQLAARGDSAAETDFGSDMGKAVESIPSYVERSRYFIILAPEVEHADHPGRILGYASWKSRGWCRVERMARVLAAEDAPMLLARSGGALFEVDGADYIYDPVGEGCFSVEADKERLVPTMLGLLADRLSSFLRQGKLQEFRALRARKALLLRGLPHAGLDGGDGGTPGPPAAAPQEHSGDPAAAFLEAYAFPRAAGGLSQALLDEALSFAAAAGDTPVVHAMLDRGADIEAKEHAEATAWGMIRGMRPLHHAALCGHTEVVGGLLERRAEVNARSGKVHVSCLDCAVIGCPAIVLHMLTQARADIRAKNRFGISPVGIAAGHDRSDTVTELLAMDARAGFIDLLYGLQRGGGDDAVRAILDGSNCRDLNKRLTLDFGPVALFFRMVSLPYRLWGGGGFLSLYTCNLDGAAPLHIAAMAGNVAGARALLAAGARDDAKNARGATAADLAAIFSISPEHQARFSRDGPGL